MKAADAAAPAIRHTRNCCPCLSAGFGNKSPHCRLWLPTGSFSNPPRSPHAFEADAKRVFFFPLQAAQPLHLLSAAAPRCPEAVLARGHGMGGMVLGTRCWGTRRAMGTACVLPAAPGPCTAWVLCSQAGCLQQEPGEVSARSSRRCTPRTHPGFGGGSFSVGGRGEERPSSLGAGCRSRGPQQSRACLEGDVVAAAMGRGEVLERHGAALCRAG